MTRPVGTPEGALVRQARLSAGITGKELAARLNVKGAAVSQWETGKSSVSMERLRQVASACGLEVHIELRTPSLLYD